MRFFHFCLLFCFSLFAYSDNSYVVNNEALGIQTILPGDDWSVLHQKSPQSQLAIYTSIEQKARFVLMSFPPQTYANMQQRATDIEKNAANYQQIQLQDTEINNVKAQRLIYKLYNSHVIEIGIPQIHAYTIVQLTTNVAAWQTPQQQQGWKNVFLRLRANTPQVFFRNLKNTSLQQIQTPKNITVTHHQVKIFVKNAYIDIENQVVLQARKNVAKLSLYVALGKISQVHFTRRSHRCDWKVIASKYPGLGKLIITNAKWDAQKRLHLQVKARMPYKNPQGIAMCFPTTYTTKATYNYQIYPGKNLSVITRKYFSPAKVIEFRQKVLRYSPQRFCLFIGKKYLSKKLSSSNHLIVVNGNKATVDRIHQQILFLQKLWKKTIKSDVIVIVNSDFSHDNFLSLATEDDVEKLSFVSQLAKLFVPHLAANLRLAVTSYLSALYIKSKKNKIGYFHHLDKKMASYRKIDIPTEYALADPLSITHPQIIATKAPVVFDMLRVYLGNKKFFRLWHTIVHTQKYRNYTQLIRALPQYKTFTDQWLLRAGYPQFVVSWSQSKAQVIVDIYQQMRKNPFVLSGKIYIVCREKTYTMPVKITQSHHKWFIVSEEEVERVYFRYY
ncbi:hypothetical protein [Candidatus Uabimicrobium amorphum]|uniref:Uncharacterized protein n=1 Tax=Uabimicrobium amorphum TaxID=2596890 RepID=A0A5S9F2B1_UABAM|nr:hypothetical protein [Candidatus Uabimicrobium amorphum]BBM82204.1 hypothetical protein UABAM_00547 [Candidatus Uabimicrobium amorphum]